MKHRLGVLPEVRDALATGRPVVALESTIITHGMPAPRNLETARRVEAAVRAGGAVPAHIAVLDGRIRVGLTADDLERLAGGKRSEERPVGTACVSSVDLGGCRSMKKKKEKKQCDK